MISSRAWGGTRKDQINTRVSSKYLFFFIESKQNEDEMKGMNTDLKYNKFPNYALSMWYGRDLLL